MIDPIPNNKPPPSAEKIAFAFAPAMFLLGLLIIVGGVGLYLDKKHA